MTTEEAIKVLEMFLHKQCDLERTKFAYDANTVWEAVNMAIKALEQESALDKAREEILNLIDADAYGDYQQGMSVGLSVALQAIDRSKAESEDK